MKEYKIYDKIKLSENKTQLRFAREIVSKTKFGSAFESMEFGSMVEGDNSSFMIHGRRNHSCPELTKNMELITI